MDKILVLTGRNVWVRVLTVAQPFQLITNRYRTVVILISIGSSNYFFLTWLYDAVASLPLMPCSSSSNSPVLVSFVNEACKKTCPTYNTSFLFLFLSDATPVVCLFPSRDARYPIVIKSPTGKAVTADC